MFCRKCGAPLAEDSGFCHLCGAQVVSVSQADTANKPGSGIVVNENFDTNAAEAAQQECERDIESDRQRAGEMTTRLKQWVEGETPPQESEPGPSGTAAEPPRGEPESPGSGIVINDRFETDAAQSAQENPYQSAGEPELGMKWYKFYAYVRLPLSVLLCLMDIISLMQNVDIDYVKLLYAQYYYFSIGLGLVQIVGTVVLAVSMMTWSPHVLRNFKICALGILVGGNLLGILVVSSMGLDVSSLSTSVLSSAIVEGATYFYLKKRENYFY